MARNQHLPIYQALYAFSREVHRLKVSLPKSLRSDLGSLLFSGALRCLRLTVIANGSKQKTRFLQQLYLEIEAIWVLLRLLHDLRAISGKQFMLFSERLSNIQKQCSAWIAWAKKEEGT